MAAAKRTTRIGVLSDTHLRSSAGSRRWLLELVETVLAPVDMILHAGDLVDPDLLDLLSDYEVHVVRGNMDPAVRGVPVKELISVDGFTIGLIHGWGAPGGLEERALSEFDGTDVDCLVYGHSHRPVCHRRGDVLLFNPGSATDRRGMPYHSVGLLELTARIEGTIIRLD
jgi:putative phosphoesterase